MKKLALAAIATALIGFGHAPVSAQRPIDPLPDDLRVECGESDGRNELPDGTPAGRCVRFYLDVLPPVTAPPVTTTTIQQVVLPPPSGLPKTGSGVSSILGLGAALLVGGGIVVVATRRRSTAPAH